MPKCDWCHDKGWAIATRSDGRRAVERCDACEIYATVAEAARQARIDGVKCKQTEYPHLVEG